MLRVLTALLVVFGLSGSLSAEEEAPRIAPRPLANALEAASNGRWETAARIALRDGPGASAIVEWLRLREGLGTPEEVMTFIAEHPGWPGLGDLRRRNEEVMAEAPSDMLLSFYAQDRPRTGIGALSHARALIEAGQRGEAEASLVLAWRTMDLSTEEHDAFIEAHGALLEPHHEARLRMALWRGLRDVKQMLPLVGSDLRALAEARQSIEAGRTVSDDDLPEGGANDPGIAHARFNQHIQRGRGEAARALLLEQSLIEGGLGEPERWGSWRRYLARERMRAGEPGTAYRLAAIHQLVEGANYADLEWLSGYIALTHLDAPDLALDHFQRFRSAVETPISLGRAGYWIGRAQEALGDTEAAQIAYEFGAGYQTSFYGLLSAERAGLPPDPTLAGRAPERDWREADFTRDPVFQAGVLLRTTGRLSLAERFFIAVADGLDEDGLIELGAALDEMGEPHLQVMVGKAAAQRGITVPGPYYALHPLAGMTLPVPVEMALAIARRESEFDPRVVSGAGAQGLMQLMPGTASDVARDLGLAHDRSRVLEDWRYNARLGAEYIAQLSRRFDGNLVMVSAGYNAGPGRPITWMRERGDPREAGGMDVIDWIEHIPFRETRNYVMRVAESLPVYRARLGKEPHPMPFSEELVGRTLALPATD